MWRDFTVWTSFVIFIACNQLIDWHHCIYNFTEGPPWWTEHSGCYQNEHWPENILTLNKVSNWTTILWKKTWAMITKTHMNITKNTWGPWVPLSVTEPIQYSKSWGSTVFTCLNFHGSSYMSASIRLWEPQRFIVTWPRMWSSSSHTCTINQDGQVNAEGSQQQTLTVAFFLTPTYKNSLTTADEHIQSASELSQASKDVRVNNATIIKFNCSFVLLLFHLICPALLPMLCFQSITMWPHRNTKKQLSAA